MLRLQKLLQVKSHMRGVFETSRIRLLKEFGAENKALEHVSQSHCDCSEYCIIKYLSTVQYVF